MNRRDAIGATAGIVLAGTSSAAVPGDTVAWPDGVALLDGGLWTPRAGHAPLQVLGVAADRDAAAVRRHQQSLGHGFPVTLDGSAFAGLSARRLIPLTITVDRAGRLREIIAGEMTADDVMGLAALAR